MSPIRPITLALLAMTSSSAAQAQSASDIKFEASPRNDGYIRFHIDNDWDGDRGDNWNTRLDLDEVKGLTAEDIARGGAVSFAYVRPAGRFDCAGKAQDNLASGTCSFTVNDAFARLLDARGVEKPSRRQYYGLALSGVDSDVLDALVKEGMGTPTPSELITLGIFRVTPDYVRAMAHINGMEVEIHDLVQFKIFKITPESVKAYAALGYRKLTARDLVQFSIFKVTPDYIRALADLGYRDLSSATLVRMRMFGVTPDYVRNTAERTGTRLSAEELVKRRITPIMPQYSWTRDRRRNWRWDDGRQSND